MNLPDFIEALRKLNDRIVTDGASPNCTEVLVWASGDDTAPVVAVDYDFFSPGENWSVLIQKAGDP